MQSSHFMQLLQCYTHKYYWMAKENTNMNEANLILSAAPG
jgi:hypothetical protein